MAELTITTFLSLDGVMQAPGGPGEDPSGGFSYGGWLVPHADAAMGEFMDEVFEKAGSFLLGRATYQIFAAHWPRVRDAEDPVAAALNTLPKHVASTTLTELHWNNSRLLRGDLSAEVSRLKSEPGKEIQVHGSAGLAQTLLAEDLIDEFRLLVFPVVLGTGKRLFGPGARPGALKLIDARTTSTGVTISTYRRAGALQLGSFELEPSGGDELSQRG
jgi:dihydrofolate reductase